MKFTKMHGLGNDFVLVEAENIPTDVEQLAQQICDRHRGVGADGLVYLLPSERANVRMRIFNADGSESEQCGNAIRCVTKYYMEQITNQPQETCQIETNVGVQNVWVEYRGRQVVQVRVDMGEPILSGSDIPVSSTKDLVLDERLIVEDRTFLCTAVSMGNPHGVIEVEDAKTFAVERWGPPLEVHSFFPQKANIEFITIHGPSEITMRVWERSVGQTMACGSGACAVLVAAVLKGKTERQATIHLLGGDLQIEWRQEDNRVYMTGPATYVFQGEWFTQNS